ncbi:unnamed protein product [Echinostoma caproni]|uniref:Col_cuticle_N domain-containing protein n=1 Tax=Echinostoma caproni TaxID=27848 RepID=A0A3P8GQE3_9TREM|nr:unnamed protein product [Echinostoma caproni]
MPKPITINVPCTEAIAEAAVSYEHKAADVFKMKKISVLPIISTFVVCAMFGILTVLQYQVQKIQEAPTDVMDSVTSETW